MRDGNLTVIDSIFMNNQAAPLGPDTGGGAIYVVGSKNGVLIVGSTFSNNAASNAGAVGCLFAELDVYNSLFTNNTAIGTMARTTTTPKCSVINNGQNEVGSGGNGGALYSDGNSVNITLCGDAILNNNAGQGAFGGGLFFTSNNMGGTLSIADTTMTGNTGGHWTVVSTGSVTNAGTAVGTNCEEHHDHQLDGRNRDQLSTAVGGGAAIGKRGREDLGRWRLAVAQVSGERAAQAGVLAVVGQVLEQGAVGRGRAVVLVGDVDHRQMGIAAQEAGVVGHETRQCHAHGLKLVLESAAVGAQLGQARERPPRCPLRNCSACRRSGK
jgi:hypothetical protein